MTKCNCDICIGREDIDGNDVCCFAEKDPKKDVIPMFIRRTDGSKPTAKEVMTLYNKVNKEYGN